MIMLWVVACVCLVLMGTVESASDEKWKQYKIEYNKTFTSQEEDDSRRLIWERNLEYIRQHNLEADSGLHSYRLGVNAFADLSLEEFFQQRTGQVVTNRVSGNSRSLRRTSSLPTYVNWEKQGYVTPVKNQGDECNCGYAFSAVGCVEGQYFKATGNLVSLSAQNIVDCSLELYGTFGCEGGSVVGAFEYMMGNGIASEEAYPYVQRAGLCQIVRAVTRVENFMPVRSGDELDLQRVVAVIGPVSAEISVPFDVSFQLYKSGVYDNPACTSDFLNHAVLVIGYGEGGGEQYWFVKNSWGTDWGSNGYMMMSRNKGNQCGIASRASFALLELV